jgi:hypothetical protein
MDGKTSSRKLETSSNRKKKEKKRQHFELSTKSDEPEKKDQYELKHLG